MNDILLGAGVVAFMLAFGWLFYWKLPIAIHRIVEDVTTGKWPFEERLLLKLRARFVRRHIHTDRIDDQRSR